MLQEVFELFRAREPIPFIILAMLCVGWVIIIERIVLLQLTYRVNFKKFNETLRKMLSAGDLGRARSYCLASGKVGLPLIAVRAIEAYESDAFKVRAVVSEETLSFLPRVRRRLSQLPNLATAAVLLGALAAVHGVWQSFQAVDVLELGVKSFVFTRGLSQALTPLALALTVSVLLMLPYGLLEAISVRLEWEVEHSLTIILNILAPETQTVMAAPIAGAVAGDFQKIVDEPVADLAHDHHAAAEPQGNLEDVSHDKIEPVPDEEEII